jgi:hypothetical protein
MCPGEECVEVAAVEPALERTGDALVVGLGRPGCHPRRAAGGRACPAGLRGCGSKCVSRRSNRGAVRGLPVGRPRLAYRAPESRRRRVSIMGSGPVRKPSADDQLMRAFGNGDEAALQELHPVRPRCVRDRAPLLPRCRSGGGVRRAHLHHDVASIIAIHLELDAAGNVGRGPGARGGAADVRISPRRFCRPALGGRTKTDGGQPAVA